MLDIVVFSSSSQFQQIPTTLVESQWFPQLTVETNEQEQGMWTWFLSFCFGHRVCMSCSRQEIQEIPYAQLFIDHVYASHFSHIAICG